MRFIALDIPMKRKPDLLWVLVVLFGLGVVTTGYTQTFWERSVAEQVSDAQASSSSDWSR